ncbi:MAG: hypothetical protein JSV48_19600, partial [Bradyrhizobium sp.]
FLAADATITMHAGAHFVGAFIEGQIGEIKSMLSQMAASSGVSQGADAASRPPRTKRPPSVGGEQA